MVWLLCHLASTKKRLACPCHNSVYLDRNYTLCSFSPPRCLNGSWQNTSQGRGIGDSAMIKILSRCFMAQKPGEALAIKARGFCATLPINLCNGQAH